MCDIMINDMKRHMILTDDMRCNYMCGEEPEPENNYDKLISKNKKVIGIDKVDYMLNTETEEPEPEFTEKDMVSKSNTEDKQKQLSYLSVKSVEEGINWYKQEFPMIPDELLPLMSRWNFGNLNEETKKSVKNNKKKQLKKKNKVQSGLTIVNKPILITFD